MFAFFSDLIVLDQKKELQSVMCSTQRNCKSEKHSYQNFLRMVTNLLLNRNSLVSSMPKNMTTSYWNYRVCVRKDTTKPSVPFWMWILALECFEVQLVNSMHAAGKVGGVLPLVSFGPTFFVLCKHWPSLLQKMFLYSTCVLQSYLLISILSFSPKKCI